MCKEIWRDIPGFEGHYQASSLGRIKGPNKIRAFADCGPYLHCTLSLNGTYYTRLVHTLIALSFPEICGEWFPGAQISHLDENPHNNVPENLRWTTSKENNNWGHRTEKASISKTNGKRSKPVKQCSLDGTVIKEYPSLMEAYRQGGYNTALTSLCARGKKETAYGYIWKYN